MTVICSPTDTGPVTASDGHGIMVLFSQVAVTGIQYNWMKNMWNSSL